ncbi:GNAT family N-acetyltransferase [Methylobacterium sp. WL8]|nr:GNAT family N-acetyltransferase [Methylobacterium sp. WL120]TXM67170.1 GNAT family N-acetyltransferase [Methylobacterium sp. WL120]TXM97400.1 GNAT family N-acetyltransferase [Methylobacterium sp. WL122]TXN81447.1 GNAT family N-acetyltransferase [Methylobacterium sp. WL8]
MGALIGPPVPLGPEHALDGFSCGRPVLDDWLKRQARRSEGRFARTYVVCADGAVVGYYCISAGTVAREDAPGRIRRNAPEPIPVSILGRLAVDQRWAGRGLGADLLADALRRIANAADVIGIGAVLIHALDDQALAFYRRQAEFLEFPDRSRTLFLPIGALTGGR